MLSNVPSKLVGQRFKRNLKYKPWSVQSKQRMLLQHVTIGDYKGGQEKYEEYQELINLQNK